MSNKNFDWSCFAVRISSNAPIEKLYRCWATRQGIESWFLRQSEYKKADDTLYADTDFVQPGDKYTWRWHGYPDDVFEEGEIIEANGKDLFQFRFGDAGICTVQLYVEQGENIVELIQSEIPTTEEGKEKWHIGCKTGWTFYLANLKSIMEGGIDLRNRNVKLQNVISA